jgi:hypothetical protein
MPVFCIAESVSAIRDKERRIEAHIEDGKEQRREATRSSVSSAHLYAECIAEMKGHTEAWLNQISVRFHQFLEKLPGAVEMIEIDSDSLRLGSALMKRIELRRADAFVLAAILRHAGQTADMPKAFVSGNTKDFKRAEIESELNTVGVEYFARAESVLGRLGLLTDQGQG